MVRTKKMVQRRLGNVRGEGVGEKGTWIRLVYQTSEV